MNGDLKSPVPCTGLHLIAPASTGSRPVYSRTSLLEWARHGWLALWLCRLEAIGLIAGLLSAAAFPIAAALLQHPPPGQVEDPVGAVGTQQPSAGREQLTEPAPDNWSSDELIQPVLLRRIERIGLALLAACGSVAIGWTCLMLDHLTRHHFSRRFQTIAVLVWTLFVAAIAWLFASLAT